MAHPNTSDENQEQNQNQNQNNDQNNGGTDDDLGDLPPWQAALHSSHSAAQIANENARRAQERADNLERELTEIRNRQNNPPEVLQQGDPFNEPERFRRILNNDVAQQVAPLNRFVDEMGRERLYYRIKANIRSNFPQNQQQLFAAIEPALDNYFLSNSNITIDQQAVVDKVEVFVARMIIQSQNQNNNNFQNNNNQNQNNNNRQNNNNQQNDMRPPHLRTSQRTNNTNQNNNQNNQNQDLGLTAEEKRLAREKGMTDQEFRIMQTTDPRDAGAAWLKIKEDRKKAKQQQQNGGQ